jgi:hypothetical protein
MKVIRSTETSVHTRTTWRYIPQAGNIHNYRCDYLKSNLCLTNFTYRVFENIFEGLKTTNSSVDPYAMIENLLDPVANVAGALDTPLWSHGTTSPRRHEVPPERMQTNCNRRANKPGLVRSGFGRANGCQALMYNPLVSGKDLEGAGTAEVNLHATAYTGRA